MYPVLLTMPSLFVSEILSHQSTNDGRKADNNNFAEHQKRLYLYKYGNIFGINGWYTWICYTWIWLVGIHGSDWLLICYTWIWLVGIHGSDWLLICYTWIWLVVNMLYMDLIGWYTWIWLVGIHGSDWLVYCRGVPEPGPTRAWALPSNCVNNYIHY